LAWTINRNLTEESQSKGKAIAESIASSSVELLFNRDPATVQAMMDERRDGIPGVSYIFVVDEDGDVVCHTFVPTIPDEARSIVKYLSSNHGLAPDEAKLRSFHETYAEAPPHDSEAELEWDHIERDWPWDIQRDLEAIAEGDLADTFGTGQFVQHMMLYDVLEATSIGLQQRRALLTTLLWQSKHVVLYALKRGRGERYVNWSLFGWHEFDSHQFGDLAAREQRGTAGHFRG